MIEVEQKFRVDDKAHLVDRLTRLGAEPGPVQRHRDTYFNHPSRDFAATGEAFRVRRIDGVPLITYKAARLAGAIKARRELEWRLDPGDPCGDKMEELLVLLGFRRVREVVKIRLPYRLEQPVAGVSVVIDTVDTLGDFAELELLVASESEVETARARIRQLSRQLGLRAAEPRSYLQLVLESNSEED